jgi:hypothetical protein
MADAIKRRFLIGALLAWVPWIPVVIGLRELFRGMSNTKATGVGALAVSLGEGFALWGIVAMIVTQVAAIIWLAKSFAPDNWWRNLVSVVSIVLSGLMLVLVCIFAGSVWLSRHG